MAKSAIFTLKLLVDEKKNNVVLAEAGQDFVDVLYGLLTLPMGTIARLLEKHQKLPQVLSCFKNLNKSVADMVTDDFETEACKNMLMYPKSNKTIHCRRLKLNIDDTPTTKFFVCPNFHWLAGESSCSKAYSNFKSSRCRCGSLMTQEFYIPEDEQVICSIGNAVDGVFVDCRSSFIVTDDLKVMLNSIDEIFNVVSGLGYPNLDDLREMVVDVGFEEVLTLLGNIFVSETPLTCTFLWKLCFTMMLKMPSQLMLTTKRVEQEMACSVKVFVRKLDMKIVYAECSEDFIDSLLTFLVIPLELGSSFSNDNTILGCVRNLCIGGNRRQFHYDYGLPGYYACSKKLLDTRSFPSPVFECLISNSFVNCKFARKIGRIGLSKGDKVVTVNPIDPKNSSSGSQYIQDIGFVKRKTKFIVSDDLTITPMNKFSTIGLLKKMQINMKDLEAQSISVYKAELINILKASLTSPSALTNGLSYLLTKEPKKET